MVISIKSLLLMGDYNSAIVAYYEVRRFKMFTISVSLNPYIEFPNNYVPSNDYSFNSL